MINYKIYFTLILSILIFSSCHVNEQRMEELQLKDEQFAGDYNLIMNFTKGKAFNHPSFVVWAEDLNGKLLKTILITESYASGVFNYKMQGDTLWHNTPGESIQPAALPYWTFKKGEIINNQHVPTKANPYVDAYTAATPKSDFKFKTKKIEDLSYRIFVEVNQPWDWNSYWTNNKYPANHAYKHSAQPSLIYAVNVNAKDSVYYLNPIGHGDPKGETAKLFTNLSTLTTAKAIFSEIKLVVK